MSSPQGAREFALPHDWSSMRELRRARGFSQTRLAELSGVSERTVRAIEAGTVGRPQHESLRRIAAVLAYGESHRGRLVERWTGSTVKRTPDEMGIPDWEVIYRRIGARGLDDGGQISSLLCDVTIGPDRVPLTTRYLQVHEPMSASGPPVLWTLTSSPTFDVSTARVEVSTGGVVDDFFVEGDVSALAVRPDPAMAQKGPFVVEFVIDYTDAERLDSPPESEWMYGASTPMQLAMMVVRFTGPQPRRLWSVRGTTAARAERVNTLHVAPDATVQVCHQDMVGVFGIQWDWDDDAEADTSS